MNKFTEPEPSYSDENLMGEGCYISLAVIVFCVWVGLKCAAYLIGVQP